MGSERSMGILKPCVIMYHIVVMCFFLQLDNGYVDFYFICFFKLAHFFLNIPVGAPRPPI